MTDTTPAGRIDALVVDNRVLRRVIETLRVTARPFRCFWCARPLVGGICAVCDEGSL
jgi:hypothetical protein